MRSNVKPHKNLKHHQYGPSARQCWHSIPARCGGCAATQKKRRQTTLGRIYIHDDNRWDGEVLFDPGNRSYVTVTEVRNPLLLREIQEYKEAQAKLAAYLADPARSEKPAPRQKRRIIATRSGMTVDAIRPAGLGRESLRPNVVLGQRAFEVISMAGNMDPGKARRYAITCKFCDTRYLYVGETLEAVAREAIGYDRPLVLNSH